VLTADNMPDPGRLARWTRWLDETLLPPVPHRPVVLTIPKRLRPYCLSRRVLLGDPARLAARIVTACVRATTGEPELRGGGPSVRLDLLTYDPATEQLSYRSDKTDGPTAGTAALDPREVLARLLTHIPDPGQVMTRDCGWHASRTRGTRARLACDGRRLTAHAPPVDRPFRPT
jgi:hypothetical protein